MVSKSTQRAALMSIRPRFASAILDGSKQIEFRKRSLAVDITRVVIYTTSPVQAVVGEFTIADQIVDSPKNLWSRYSRIAGIDKESFFEYFSGSEKGVGILINDVTEYRLPRTLDEVVPGSSAPQSFRYFMQRK